MRTNPVTKINTLSFLDKYRQLFSDAKYSHLMYINDGTEQGLKAAYMKRYGRFGKEFEIYKSICYQIAKPIERDMIQVKNMPRDLSAAWKSEKSIAKKTKVAYEDGIKPHLPGVLGYICTFIPLPLAQPLGYALGKIFKRLT